MVDVLCAIFVLILFFYGTWQSGNRLARYWGHQQWPTAEGVITDVGMYSRTTYDGDPPTKNTVHTMSIAYSYVVDGVTYAGSRVTAEGNPSSMNIKNVQKAMVRFNKGDAVAVAFNPQSPEDAVLETAPLHGSLLVFLLLLGSTAWIMKYMLDMIRSRG